MKTIKEFNLSDFEEEYGSALPIEDRIKYFRTNKIKEFIKRLKVGTKLRQMVDGHDSIDFIFNNFIEDIDKLAGDKLK